MSKRDEDSQSDIEVGMTTAERRRRRRRGGGLRVPSDNVPRRNTSPPVVAPVPEDPALAMSIAYSFTSDGSEPVPRISAHDLANDPATSTGPFAPIAPDAATTAQDAAAPEYGDADGDSSDGVAAGRVEDGGFETKTREMSAVDLDALGLSELATSGSNSPSSSPPPAAGTPARVSSAGITPPAASSSSSSSSSAPSPSGLEMAPAASGTSGAFSIRVTTPVSARATSHDESSVTIDPSLYGGVVEDSVDDAVPAQARPSDVDIDVDGLAETTLDAPADAVAEIDEVSELDSGATMMQMTAAGDVGFEPGNSRAQTAPVAPPPAPPRPTTPRAQTSPPVLPRAQTSPPVLPRAQTSPPVAAEGSPHTPTAPMTLAERLAAAMPTSASNPAVALPPPPSSPALVPPGAVTAQSMPAMVMPPVDPSAPTAGSASMSSPALAPPPSTTSSPSIATIASPSIATPTASAAPHAPDAEPVSRPRFKTMALNEDDLEEVREAARQMRAAAEPGVAAQLAAAAAAVPQSLGRSTEQLSIPDIEVQELGERSEGSGEILVDVDDAVEVKPRTSPPEPPRRPSSVPPPIGNPALASAQGAALAQSSPSQPLPTAPHASPPPPPPAVAKAPPAPPPTKKAPPPAPATAPSAAAADAKTPRGKPWFVDLFDEDYLRTLPFLTPQATQSEAEFVIDAMGLAPGAQVLDVGCGYGRHAMELAARGLHVVGLDLSTPLLVRGGEEAHRRGLTINFVRGDMRELDFDGQFDGAYCLFSTFGYFDDETNKKTAQNIARALRPGGKVLIEILNRDYVIADLPTRVWWEGDGCVVLEEVELNYFSSRIQVNRSVVFDDGRQLEQEISVRAYSLHEVGKLMHSAGFRVLEVSGGYQTRGRFFGNQSRHIIVLAERTAAPAR